MFTCSSLSLLSYWDLTMQLAITRLQLSRGWYFFFWQCLFFCARLVCKLCNPYDILHRPFHTGIVQNHCNKDLSLWRLCLFTLNTTTASWSRSLILNGQAALCKQWTNMTTTIIYCSYHAVDLALCLHRGIITLHIFRHIFYGLCDIRTDGEA